MEYLKTLDDYITGKVEVGKRQGPPSVLHDLLTGQMNRIKLGADKFVKWFLKILYKDGRLNSVKNNHPGKDWWLHIICLFGLQ